MRNHPRLRIGGVIPLLPVSLVKAPVANLGRAQANPGRARVNQARALGTAPVNQVKDPVVSPARAPQLSTSGLGRGIHMTPHRPFILARVNLERVERDPKAATLSIIIIITLNPRTTTMHGPEVKEMTSMLL